MHPRLIRRMVVRVGNLVSLRRMKNMVKLDKPCVKRKQCLGFRSELLCHPTTRASFTILKVWLEPTRPTGVELSNAPRFSGLYSPDSLLSREAYDDWDKGGPFPVRREADK